MSLPGCWRDCLMKYECNKQARLKVKLCEAPGRRAATQIRRRRLSEQTHIRAAGGGGTTHSSPNVISMQMKGAGIRGSKEEYARESPAVAMGTEISYHQSQVGHEADELRGWRRRRRRNVCLPLGFRPSLPSCCQPTGGDGLRLGSGSLLRRTLGPRPTHGAPIKTVNH